MRGYLRVGLAGLLFAGIAVGQACAAETLAGITIGDSLATVTQRKGKPVAVTDSTVPGARNYHFRVDPGSGIDLEVAVRNSKVVMVAASLTGKVRIAKLQKYLGMAATGRGLRLTGDERKVYGRGRSDFAHPSEDLAIINYLRGDLALICVSTFTNDPAMKFGLTQFLLVRRGFPPDWVPFHGPI
jgi:hypothetical protein